MDNKMCITTTNTMFFKLKHKTIFTFIICYIFNGSLYAQSGNQYSSPTEAFRKINVQVPAKTQQPTPTRIWIEKGEYVFIEALGEITIGQVMKNVYADGVPDNRPFATSTNLWYNKYNCRHGALILILNNQLYPCHQILSTKVLSRYNTPLNPFTPDYAPFKFVDALDKYGQVDFKYVPGVYFIAPSTGELYFDLNDKKITDNEGQFTLTIYTMKKKDHMNRNQFNRCPNIKPVDKKDCEGNLWFEEPMQSAYYHGISNNAYRGYNSYSGCQCVYDDQGKLLIGHKHQGSFDFGYWIMKGNYTDPFANYLHLILDVIPHDLYINEEANALYNNPKQFCLLRPNVKK